MKPGTFERYDDGNIRALITGFPLAWVTAAASPAITSLLPPIGDYDGAGRLVTLIGHCVAPIRFMPRAKPIHAQCGNAPAVSLGGKEAPLQSGSSAGHRYHAETPSELAPIPGHQTLEHLE